MSRPAHHGVEIWLCVEPVDFRKQITGLATLVQDTLSMDPFSAQLFVLTNRRRTQCRVLYWERCGFVLWHKRLERARFAWPRHGDAVVSLSGAQLNFLLDGYDLWRMSPHPQGKLPERTAGHEARPAEPAGSKTRRKVRTGLRGPLPTADGHPNADRRSVRIRLRCLWRSSMTGH